MLATALLTCWKKSCTLWVFPWMDDLRAPNLRTMSSWRNMTKFWNSLAFELPNKVFLNSINFLNCPKGMNKDTLYCIVVCCLSVQKLFSVAALSSPSTHVRSCFSLLVCGLLARPCCSRGRLIYLPSPHPAHVLPAHPSLLYWLCSIVSPGYLCH